MNQKKIKKRNKKKFKASLLNQDFEMNPEDLLKKRVSFAKAISMPIFKNTSIEWLKLFQDHKEKFPIKRDLVGNKNNSDFLSQRTSEVPKIPDLKSKSIYVEKTTSKSNKNFSSNSNWLIIEPTFVVPLKDNSLRETESYWVPPKPKKNRSNDVIKFNNFNFDASVIPQRRTSCVTVDDVVNYLKFKSRLTFK